MTTLSETTTPSEPQPAPLSAGRALSFVVLLGVVSLFADLTYEGARGLNGPYLSFLGASATAVGLAAGAGELLGYALRFFTGYLSDRTQRYWAITFAGYLVNLLAAPALALVGRWEWAVGLIFAERIGKAIRNPARDAMLSYASSQLGTGKSFGLHEALDQIGGVLGPAFVAVVLMTRASGSIGLDTYHLGYALLLIPAALALAILTVARWRFRHPAELASKTPKIAARGYAPAYWWFLLAAGLIAAGFADYPLIAYHFEKMGRLSVEWIPALYALAMAVDAVAALLLGRWFDQKGLVIVIGAFAVSALAAPLAFLGDTAWSVVGVTLWGIGMGAQESVLRAALVGFVRTERRATAFGLFHTVFGVFWFAGSALMGFLYDQSLIGVVIFSVVAQAAALPLFWVAARRAGPQSMTR